MSGKKKNNNMKGGAKYRKNRSIYVISIVCAVLFLLLLFINPSAYNTVGFAACLLCALKLHSEVK